MAKMRFHKLAALVVLGAAGLWVYTGDFASVGSATNGQDEPPRAEAEAEPVLRTVAFVQPPRIEHARSIRISGNTKSDKRAELATRSGGIIAKLPHKQGDWVEAGDLIVALEAEEKNAMIETARKLLTQREAELEATEKLVKQGTIASLRADEARSAVAAARSQLEIAQVELDRLDVKAPFSGIIDRIDVELGSSVQQGAKIATLVSLDPMLAVGEVSEHDLEHIEIGDKASVRLVDGRLLEGNLRYVSREASPQTRTFPIEIALPNPEGAILAGMTAEITLHGNPVSAVVLPRSVVTLSVEGDLGIKVLDGEDKVDFIPIDLVDDTPRGLVLGGVPVGARIVVAGQDLVAKGEKVNGVEADPETVQKLIGEFTGSVN